MSIPEEVIERAAKALFEIRDDQYDDRGWVELGSADRELYECQARTAAPIIVAWAREQALADVVRRLGPTLESDMYPGEWGRGFRVAALAAVAALKQEGGKSA